MRITFEQVLPWILWALIAYALFALSYTDYVLGKTREEGCMVAYG